MAFHLWISFYISEESGRLGIDAVFLATLILFTSEISSCSVSDRPPAFKVSPLGEEGSGCSVFIQWLAGGW